MKNLLYILLFLPCLLFAQREVATDTSYIQKAGVNFYHVAVTTYVEGPQTQSVDLLGDTAALISYYANQSVNQAGQISSAAVTVIRRGAVIQLLRRWDAAVLALTGQSPLRAIQTSIEGPLKTGTWNLIDAGVSKSVVFSNNPTTGALRYFVTGSTQKAVETFGAGWIMLKNYPTAGLEQSMYQVTPKIWMNLDKTLILRKL